MNAKELREKKKEELTALLEERQSKVQVMRFDIASKQVKNHREFRVVKKDIARIHTLLSERRAEGK